LRWKAGIKEEKEFPNVRVKRWSDTREICRRERQRNELGWRVNDQGCTAILTGEPRKTGVSPCGRGRRGMVGKAPREEKGKIANEMAAAGKTLMLAQQKKREGKQKGCDRKVGKLVAPRSAGPPKKR